MVVVFMLSESKMEFWRRRR